MVRQWNMDTVKRARKNDQISTTGNDSHHRPKKGSTRKRKKVEKIDERPEKMKKNRKHWEEHLDSEDGTEEGSRLATDCGQDSDAPF